MAFLVATMSLPAVYRPNSYARMMTAGTPHARANTVRSDSMCHWSSSMIVPPGGDDLVHHVQEVWEGDQARAGPVHLHDQVLQEGDVR